MSPRRAADEPPMGGPPMGAAQSSQPPQPSTGPAAEPVGGFASRDDVWQWFREARNWGRWGEDDERGTVNLITPEKRRRAAALVRTGELFSLSRPFPLEPAPNNPSPAQRYTTVVARDAVAGSAVDYLGINTHGTASTHLDALCHMWDGDGMWNGRDPAREITADGSRFAGIDALAEGIVTRAVLLDVPRFRGVSYVTQDEPVTGDELAAVARSIGVSVEPGDAVLVHCGRERWDADHGAWGAGSLDVEGSRRPGLHVSCLRFLRQVDAGLLAWDMMDVRPNGFELAFAVHAAIWALGLPLLDNALLEPLATACAAQQRWEFMLAVAPLPISGATGSPVNPIALL